jgi:hypothetical protein
MNRKIKQQAASSISKGRTVRTRNQGGSDITIIESVVDNVTGLSGTAGPPSTPLQAMAEAMSQAAKAGARATVAKSKGATAIKQKGTLQEGYAVATTVNPKVFWDSLALTSFCAMFNHVISDWQQNLAKGTYKIYRLVDRGEITHAGTYITVAIATDKSRILWLKRLFIPSDDLHVEFWKEIKGSKPLPKPKIQTPIHPKPYRTFKQG